MTVRTRFAPSPTGYLHIGGVRTAFFNWLFAKANDGQFILRIDDTDQQRNDDATLQPILDGFRWLNIDWDEGPEVGGDHGPYFQSERNDLYAAAVEQLLASGAAYRDFAKPDELTAEREAAEKSGGSFTYSRSWMAETDEDAAKFEAEGRKMCVRMKMPREGTCVVNDLILGDTEFAWSREQDTIIARSNGAVTYHLANVVDDAAMKITHVIRAQEHLSNTPRQIFIAQSLGYEIPQYAHIPVVNAPGGGGKMSKRHIAKYLNNREFKKLYEHGSAIAEQIGIELDPATFNPVLANFYRDVGYLPGAVVNALLMLGWSLDGEREFFTRDEMQENFTLDRVIKSSASFDPNKMLAFQAHHFADFPLKQKVAMCLPYLQKAGLVDTPPSCDVGPYLSSIIENAEDRIKVAGDILQFGHFFIADAALEFEEKAFQKRLRKPERAGELLAKFRERLANSETFVADALESLMKTFIEEEDIQIGEIIHAVRVSSTGRADGFGVYQLLEVLGKDRVLARIDRALAKLNS